MKKLTTIIKKLTGRQLGENQLGELLRRAYAHGNIESNHKTIDYSIENEDVVVKTTLYKYATTDDFSYGSRIQHTGYYPHYVSVKTYTLDGLLKKKSISTGDGEVFLNAGGGFYKKITYSPPGRLIGRKIRR